jgi:hypothetical protein
MATFDPLIKSVLEEMFRTNTFLRPGKMFGLPAWYVGKKLCVCLYEEGVCIKLPLKTVSRLLETDSQFIPFQPYGKAVMREWVQLNLLAAEDYRAYGTVFDEAVQFLLDLNPA